MIELKLKKTVTTVMGGFEFPHTEYVDENRGEWCATEVKMIYSMIKKSRKLRAPDEVTFKIYTSRKEGGLRMNLTEDHEDFMVYQVHGPKHTCYQSLELTNYQTATLLKAMNRSAPRKVWVTT